MPQGGGVEGVELARVVEVHAGRLIFVKASDRSTTIFAVPVPSRKGSALLLFAARSGSGGRRWWSPTLALAGAPLRAFVESLLRIAERGGSAAYRSRKSGLFVAVRRRGSGYVLLLGGAGGVFASLRLSRGDLRKAAELLEGVTRAAPNELPLPLTWKVKEAVFGPHAS